jgi:phage terminase large subunit-like protein
MSTLLATRGIAQEFNRLSDLEQQEVAKRLLKLEESGWKPFWCKDKDCDGNPHWLVGPDGAAVFLETGSVVPPNVTVDPAFPEGYVVEYDDGGTVNWGLPVLDPAWSHNHARADQRLPGWSKPWTLFIMSGRGAGKTTTGVEFVTLCARKGLDGAILGRRGTELVNTHVATLLVRAHPDFRPIFYASKDILVWPNGATTYLFSAEKPENIRSVNISYAWVDEAAHMDEIETAWMNIKLATRIEKPGSPIHKLITSTPTPTQWVMKMEDDPDIIVRRVSTYANRANLSKDYMEELEKSYEGTRIGRQELHGEVLRDVEGAMWNDDMFTHFRCSTPEMFDALLDAQDDIVLAVDPAGSKGKRSDATGIIGVGAMHFGEDSVRLRSSTFDVLCRATIKGTPNEWAEQTFKAARHIKARRIRAEKNFGGDMVKQVLTDYARLNPEETCDENGERFVIEVVHAVKSKETRAEATVGKYEQGRVRHVTSPGVYGDLSDLEKQQVTWVPKSRGGRMPSPNDIDALVWAVMGLEAKNRFAAQSAGRDTLKKFMKGRQ